GNRNRVKKLLKEWGKYGGTLTRALSEAAKHDRKNIVSYLLKRMDVDRINSAGRTALIETVLAGHVGGAALLLECNADPNVCDSVTGNSPLILATECGNCEMVGILITRGANPNYINPNRGMSALMLACQQGHQTVVETLCNLPSCDVELLNAKRQNSLMFACTYGSEGVVALLLDKGCLLDVADDDGATAFLKAAAHGHLGIIRQLVNKGCGTDVVDKAGRNALSLALASQHTEVVEFFRTASGTEHQNLPVHVERIKANNCDSLNGRQTAQNDEDKPVEIDEIADKKGEVDGVIDDMETTDVKLGGRDIRPVVVNVTSSINDPAGAEEEIKEATLGPNDCGNESCEEKEADTTDLVNRSKGRELCKEYPKARTFPRRSKSTLTEQEHSMPPNTLKAGSHLPPVDLIDNQDIKKPVSAKRKNGKRSNDKNDKYDLKKK
ncbi:unnamed protein product, partial [Lymnaea stagnalis]